MHDGLSGGPQVDRAMDADLGGGEHHVGVVLLKAGLDDVALLQPRQHGAAPGDDDAVALTDAQVAAVRADDAGEEEVAADGAELVEDGGALRVTRSPRDHRRVRDSAARRHSAAVSS